MGDGMIATGNPMLLPRDVMPMTKEDCHRNSYASSTRCDAGD